MPSEEVGWSLTPTEDDLFNQHNDEKTSPKWVRRGELIYPPCPMAAPLRGIQARWGCQITQNGLKWVWQGLVDLSAISH